MPTEGACHMVLGKSQQICGNSQQSSSCFALLSEPNSGLCCCFSPKAHRHCWCYQPPSQIQALQRVRFFAVLNVLPTACQDNFIWSLFAQKENRQWVLQLWSKPLAWSFLGFPLRWCAAAWEWLFSLELTMHPACHLCPNCICTALCKAALPNLIFSTSWIDFQALHEFILLPGMETPLSVDTLALNVSDVELWHGMHINFLLMGKSTC